MTVDNPTDAPERPGLRLPNPPLLPPRSGDAPSNRPSTPAENGFTSPAATPQGSPSKRQLPPGAIDLPNVFEKAMKLAPSSPTKPTQNRSNLPVFSPSKTNADNTDESVIYQPPGSPTRRVNKENTSPSPTRLQKDMRLNVAPAALSRQEPYQFRDTDSAQRRHVNMRGLTSEEMEKLQSPKVKRLANVTQLCK